MKFDAIPGRHISIRLRSPFWEKNGKDDPFVDFNGQIPVRRVEIDDSRPGAFKVFAADSAYPAVADSISEARSFGAVLARTRSMLAVLRDRDARGGWNLEIVPFSTSMLDMGELQVEIDEATADLANREESYLYLPPFSVRGKPNDSSEEDHFFFVKPGASWKWQSDPGSERDTVLLDASDDLRNSSFCVCGNAHRFIVSRQSRQENGSAIGEFFIASKSTRWNQGRIPDPTIMLARGNLRFVSRAERIRQQVQIQLDALTRDESSYLHRWDAFNKLEEDITLEKARALGAIPWSSAEQKIGDDQKDRKPFWQLKLENLSNEVRSLLLHDSVSELELVAQIPKWLHNPDMTFDDILLETPSDQTNSLNNREADPNKTPGSSRHPEEVAPKTLSASKLNFDPESGLLGVDVDASSVPQSGFVIYAMNGFITAMRRRHRARLRIQSGASANPMLGTILEEGGVPEPLERRGHVDPLSSHSLSHFKNPPTTRQRDAIDIALNTPDIALIQGPPGTGKTTVITAVLDRLNELSPKKGNDKGSVLLCGFQHDAVENMISRIQISSLPVLKFGKKAGKEEDSADVKRKKWCDGLAQKIRERNPQLKELKAETRIRGLVVQYVHSPSMALSKELCESIRDLPPGSVDVECRERAGTLLRRMSEKLEDDFDSTRTMLPLVRALRTTETGFLDDGPERADDLRDVLFPEHQDAQQYEGRPTLGEEVRELLERASNWLDGDGLDFLSDLRNLKRQLLVRYTRPPVFVVEKQSDEVLSLARDTIQSIRKNGMREKDQRTAALLEFVESLEGDPEGMVHSIAEYSFAFAATCQQCTSPQILSEKGIRNRKGVTDEDPPIEYDYVIIDEAARATPLDLLIPMAQGRRILLVGDHRQLPQMIDDELAERLDANAPQERIKELEDEKWYEESMFFYLFTKRIPQLEQRDRIPRRITLDAQFRMHRILGQFVSKNFYEMKAADERFDSPLTPDLFVHGLDVKGGGPMLWIDVSEKHGSMGRKEGKLFRECEAAIIHERLIHWMETDPHKNDDKRKLSFGVISFYRAQAEYIDGLFDVLPPEKRPEVGTVDSFQGKEFDVVFLSLVRTSKCLSSERPFGFLAVYNRLNVAMSRQKKLLVVVGDAALFDNERAEEVWGLRNYLELCRANGAVEEIGR